MYNIYDMPDTSLDKINSFIPHGAIIRLSLLSHLQMRKLSLGEISNMSMGIKLGSDRTGI